MPFKWITLKISLVLFAVAMGYIVIGSLIAGSSIIPNIPISIPQIPLMNQVLPTNLLPQTTASTTTVAPSLRSIYVTNASTAAYNITQPTFLDVNDNYANLTVEIMNGTTLYLAIESNYDVLSISGGTIRLTVNGNYDILHISNSTIASEQITGIGDIAGQ